MIEEKYINRLKERDEALERGFELIFVQQPYIDKWDERIIFGHSEFVSSNSTDFFLNGGSFDRVPLSIKKAIPWFDIQIPKRQMNLAEIDAYLHKKGRSLCKKYRDDDVYFNRAITKDAFEEEYKYLGTLNPDNTFEPLPLTEDK